MEEQLALEFVCQVYAPDEIPACWSHLPKRTESCRKIEYLYEECGCQSSFYVHTHDCNSLGDPEHRYHDDESKVFPVEAIWVMISEARCGYCTDLQIVTTPEAKPVAPTNFLKALFTHDAAAAAAAAAADRAPATDRKPVYTSIPNPHKPAPLSAGELDRRRKRFEARIWDQMARREERLDRFQAFVAGERRRDPDRKVAPPAFLFLRGEVVDFSLRIMLGDLRMLMAQGNPAGSGNSDPSIVM